MPEPGANDRNFTRPTTKSLRGPVGNRPGGRRLRKPLRIPGEYAEFRLEDGQFLIDVLGEEFFETDGGEPLPRRQRIRDGNYPLAGISRGDQRFKPRPEAEVEIPYRDGLAPPPVLSPRYYRDPVGSAGNSESRGPFEEPAANIGAGPKPARNANALPERSERSETNILPSPNRDGDFPDKWAQKGWGGPRGYYSVPTLNSGADRIANILADKPARFDIEDNPEANSDDPWYASALAGNAAIASYGPTIEKEAKEQGVDPDLAKAIAYAENSRGHYFGSAKAAEGLDMADSFLPMNINPSIWGGLGIDRKSASDYLTNIRAGITLIKRIAERIDDPSPEKVASIWNYAGRERVNDFGAYVGRMYRERPWED